MSNNGISRRNFLKGTVAGALGAGLAGALGGCSQNAALPESPDTGNSDTGSQVNVDETIDCDVVVIGGGNSGLTAAVQAAELGAKVVLLECNAALGGNGQFTEGIFAVNSTMQKAAGIDITLREIIAKEQEFFNYRVNALYWKDMTENSADNIDWLLSNGVLFSGQVDDYLGIGRVETMHWWKDGSCSIGFTEPMSAKAKELGVDIRLNTRAQKLVTEDGKIAAVLAEKAEDSYLQVNAGSVIIASGGFVDNDDMLHKLGMNPGRIIKRGMSGHNGDGISMANEVGAVDRTAKACYLRESLVDDVSICFGREAEGKQFFNPFCMWIHTAADILWVNDKAERFANEYCGATTNGNIPNAMLNQKKVFGIFDETVLSQQSQYVKDDLSYILESGYDKMFKADSIEELAQKSGLDSAALSASLQRYNTFCKNKLDEDFNKDASKLSELQAPFYALDFGYAYMASCGGIKTSRDMEVVDSEDNAIPGLYCAGMDGCMLYGETYTISICGSANGHNINSGRVAAKNAVAYLKR